ncbi:hypothetical protein LCGC14_0965050 [marine sediment metagenome]|uniref:Uncharacterized protein n=1 Tax=marine sediment metagenome TaxID=412755 RepID=A0A0F9NDF4_9ZZZZ
MASREEIREGIEQSICSNCDNVGDYEEGQALKEAQVYCHEKAICAYCTDLTNDILHKEDSQGVVIKVKDIQPINSFEDLTQSISEEGKYDIVVVESLIKEV